MTDMTMLPHIVMEIASSSPPRSYSRRRRSPSPRDRSDSRGKDLPTSLLVRNLHRDCRAEDLRGPFGRFGPLKDIYLPRDYYTGCKWEFGFVIESFEDTSEVVRAPRGFGFVQYVYPEDAADAKRYMDGEVLLGREMRVIFAEENRKKPSEMRAREGFSFLDDAGQYHQEVEVTEVDLIHVHLIAQGVAVGASAGAGAVVLIILGN
ncbi:hypothetical protein EUGRSUZ_A02501 [Eucalyptus grandis]|uniref:Uncharacterized protein n=2 Tax=Eucalyptus grandis TaxID=71139 RepID=A0ACC3M6R5_EUCGR|nr:hypothetical protein EUGRSUZ_A02501 [Eucalyptus grandis]